MGGEFEGVVRPRRTSRHTRGQAIVEFAVVLPLFLFCLIGALDCGALGSADLGGGLGRRTGRKDRFVGWVDPTVRDGAGCSSGHRGDIRATAHLDVSAP